ncbi:MAG: hypothetical protein IJ112_00205 [Oscillospiraceae bacterium]|nr:hypothetical protein [Oscillospiraceae bacterium]
MKKAWKVVLIIALVVLILGEVVLGVGLLMQGSPQTVWNTANEMFGFDNMVAFFQSENVQQPIRSCIEWVQAIVR